MITLEFHTEQHSYQDIMRAQANEGLQKEKKAMYRRTLARKGRKKAATVVAHAMLRIA
jgi:hypothetical protein